MRSSIEMGFLSRSAIILFEKYVAITIFSYLPYLICHRCDINIIVLFVSTQVPLYIANKHYGRRIPLVFVVFTSTLQFPNVLYLSDALLSFVDGFPL